MPIVRADGLPTQPLSDGRMPAHVAIIMDGNGRWAGKRFLPRIAGHKRGIGAVRTAVEYALEQGISYLTLFAFSSENWQRPEAEVSYLLDLFETVLDQEIDGICKHHVRLNVVGNLSRFPAALQRAIVESMARTADNGRLILTIAANYGGRWDIVQAISRMVEVGLPPAAIDEATVRSYLSLGDIPDPDLFIRTGGEQRISNFLLWYLAYTELFFTDSLWPDFTKDTFESAIDFYRQRERRFGRTSEQIAESEAC